MPRPEPAARTSPFPFLPLHKVQGLFGESDAEQAKVAPLRRQGLAERFMAAVRRLRLVLAR